MTFLVLVLLLHGVMAQFTSRAPTMVPTYLPTALPTVSPTFQPTLSPVMSTTTTITSTSTSTSTSTPASSPSSSSFSQQKDMENVPVDYPLVIASSVAIMCSVLCLTSTILLFLRRRKRLNANKFDVHQLQRLSGASTRNSKRNSTSMRRMRSANKNNQYNDIPTQPYNQRSDMSVAKTINYSSLPNNSTNDYGNHFPEISDSDGDSVVNSLHLVKRAPKSTGVYDNLGNALKYNSSQGSTVPLQHDTFDSNGYVMKGQFPVIHGDYESTDDTFLEQQNH